MKDKKTHRWVVTTLINQRPKGLGGYRRSQRSADSRVSDSWSLYPKALICQKNEVWEFSEQLRDSTSREEVEL